MPVITKCHECGKEKACELEPSSSTLITFSFYRPLRHIYICQKCEKKRAKKFEKILEDMGK